MFSVTSLVYCSTQHIRQVCQIPAYLFGMSDPGGVEPAPHTRNYNKLYINTSSNRLLYERPSLLIRYLNKTYKDLFLYIYNYKKQRPKSLIKIVRPYQEPARTIRKRFSCPGAYDQGDQGNQILPGLHGLGTLTIC